MSLNINYNFKLPKICLPYPHDVQNAFHLLAAGRRVEHLWGGGRGGGGGLAKHSF